MIPDMDITLTNGRKVVIVLDLMGRAHIQGEDTYLRYNRTTGAIMADATLQDGEFVTLDRDNDFVVWKPPPRYTQN